MPSTPTIAHTVESIHFRKKNKGTVLKRVHEVYLRDDIPCSASSCPEQPKCHERIPGLEQPSLLQASASHFVIPDYSVTLRFIELLEQEELSNIIFTETIFHGLQNADKSRTCKALRSIVKDSRRHSILFGSEHCGKTHALREPQETASHRDWRVLCNVAGWYVNHLKSKERPKQIVLLSEEFTQSDLILTGKNGEDGIVVLNLDAYLAQYFKDSRMLHDLLTSLKDAILEEDLINNNLVSTAGNMKKGSASSTGYQEHKPATELEAGVKSERYFQGVLQVRANQRDQAYIRGDGRIGEIVITGIINRNRAVHGDLVVVELLNREAWVAPSSRISEVSPSDTLSESLEDSGALAEETAPSLEAPGGQHQSSPRIKPAGKVVGIISRNWRPFVATLQEGAELESGSFHLVLPLDPKIPKIRIRYQTPKLLANRRIVVRIDSWPINSQYPNGHYVRSIGPIHELDTEISAILIEHGISVSQSTQGFSDGSLKEMPVNTKEEPWVPSPKDIQERRDMRKEIVFSIDPPNCQDIDDAISIKQINADGDLQFGVHIADVSYFVKENSLTDLEARARGTTVYLSDRRFDMLPKVLSEQICSLRHRVDRYAMSVIWTLDKDANVKSTWFGRTLIRSSCEMEYEQAQGLLDGKPFNSIKGLDATTARALQPSVVLLAQTMRKVRARRLQAGGLELESSEVKFKFSEGDEGINDILPKQPLEVHKIIEEAMVMANSAVARRIYEGFRETALLRHHPLPVESHFQMVQKAAESRGFKIDTSSNLALARSLADCVARTKSTTGDMEFVSLLKIMATMAMSEASYISSGSKPVREFAHYGLALEFYTHFTSPIRRYADLVVHRQLMASISGDTSSATHSARTSTIAKSPATTTTVESVLMSQGLKMEQVCAHLNIKNRASKLAQKDSTELFQSLYVLQKTRPTDGSDKRQMLIEQGIVSEIRENGFFVFVPRFGIRGPVYLRNKDDQIMLPVSVLTNNKGDKDGFVPSSECQLDSDSSTRIAVKVNSASLASKQDVVFKLFDKVQVSLNLRISHAHRHTIFMELINLEKPSAAVGARRLPPGLPSKSTPSAAGNEALSRASGLVPAEAAAPATVVERLTKEDLVSGILKGEQAEKKKKRIVIRQKFDPNHFEQTKPEASLYYLVDEFDRFRIVENR